MILCTLALHLSGTSQVLGKKVLYIKSVNFSLLTDSRWDCEEFKKSKSNLIKSQVVTREDSLLLLDSFIRESSYLKKDDEIDTRAQFSYEKNSDMTITICINRFDVLVDGKKVKNNAGFLAFLKSMVVAEHLVSPKRRSY